MITPEPSDRQIQTAVSLAIIHLRMGTPVQVVARMIRADIEGPVYADA